MGFKLFKNKVPWCKNWFLLGLESANKGYFYKSFQGSGHFGACKSILAENCCWKLSALLPYTGIVEPIFGVAALFWVVQVQLKLISCKNSRTVLLELQQADNILKGHSGTHSKRVSNKGLKKSLHGQSLCSQKNSSQRSSYKFCNTETDLRLPLKKSSNGQKSLSYRGARLWK